MSDPQKDLFEKPRHAPNADVEWLERFLKINDGWHTSRTLITFIGRPTSDDNRRWIRELASVSAWIISGQKGYKHIEHATAEEINHAAAWLESQAKKMGERAGAIRSNAHKIFG
ncbi:MAG TPA: hypothetical protein VHX90_01185 [Verrucomicrobiae bacterium]|jgi:hypothetical protein|nr:hypothetical protein [Verrucomicrobiae bacterium]